MAQGSHLPQPLDPLERQKFEAQLRQGLTWVPGKPRTVPFSHQELTLRTEAAIIQLGAIAQGISEIGIAPPVASGLRDLTDTYDAMRGIQSAIIKAALTAKE